MMGMVPIMTELVCDVIGLVFSMTMDVAIYLLANLQFTEIIIFHKISLGEHCKKNIPGFYQCLRS